MRLICKPWTADDLDDLKLHLETAGQLKLRRGSCAGKVPWKTCGKKAKELGLIE
jgi:hypothetical protein